MDNDKSLSDLVSEYESLYPNHCRSCGGWGTITVTDHVDYGSTVVSMDSEEGCEDCLGKGTCPQCGIGSDIEFTPERGYTPCDNCGFHVGFDTGNPGVHAQYDAERWWA